MADAQSPDPEARQARQFWGELFEADKSCTELLDRLLTAIATYIVCRSLDNGSIAYAHPRASPKTSTRATPRT